MSMYGEYDPDAEATAIGGEGTGVDDVTIQFPDDQEAGGGTDE